MNVGIRKLMRRKGSVKEGYDGRSLMGRGGITLGRRKNYGKGEDCMSEGLFSWCGEFVLGVFG
jgi:hypothetical protein